MCARVRALERLRTRVCVLCAWMCVYLRSPQHRASLEIDVNNKMGEASLDGLKKWKQEDIVSLKARLGELSVTEAKMDELLASLDVA